MPYAALSLCLLFTGWFVMRDCIRRRTVSAAVWIPTALLLILGSRPLSLWLSGGIVILREMRIKDYPKLIKGVCGGRPIVEGLHLDNTVPQLVRYIA